MLMGMRIPLGMWNMLSTPPENTTDQSLRYIE